MEGIEPWVRDLGQATAFPQPLPLHSTVAGYRPVCQSAVAGAARKRCIGFAGVFLFRILGTAWIFH
jgi:hypothetical protein